MTPERFHRIRHVLQRRQPDLTVITDQVHKGRNLAAIVRSCDAVGVDSVHCVVPAGTYRPYRGTSLGSDKWVQTNLHEDVCEPVRQLQAKGYQVLAAHAGDSAVDYRTIDYTRPTALLLGSELSGVSQQARDLVGQQVAIPMMGMVESFNVSVACAVILLEAQRQRAAAGMYDSQRLPEQQFQQRFFQWAHPLLAQYCDQRGLEYPPVREDGELVDGPQWHRKVKAG